MPVLATRSFAAMLPDGNCSPLNSIWLGTVARPLQLPQLGHIFLLFPGDTAVSCNNTTLNPTQYSLLTNPNEPITLAPAAVGQPCGQTLVLMLSPGFILDMADFLNIPPGLNQLLHNIPLPQGDELSYLLAALAQACAPPFQPDMADELMLEVVGEVLRLLRLRQEALLSLATRKQSTVADLLPRLLQARQFVEARYLEAIKVADVAGYVALSEFHFARLFKAAFNMSLHQYIMQLRLDEARRCLLTAEYLVDFSITDLSLQVGYSSLSSFIHAFKRRFGLSPANYQTQFQNEQV